MFAPRRLLGQNMAKYEENVYAYRWDVAALNDTSVIGVEHFAEVSSLLLPQPNQLSQHLLTYKDPLHLRQPGQKHHRTG